MGRRLLVGLGIMAAVAVLALLIGQAYEKARKERLALSLIQSANHPANVTVDLVSITELPPPVVRYFRHVLTDEQKLIRMAKMQQSGVLRTSITTDNWSVFTASQLVVQPARGFIWNARIEMPLAVHVEVSDSFVAGVGGGRVNILSGIVIANETGIPELNSGALHRYLAEAVWYPTALLPQSGITWSPIDDRAALATLTVKDTSVSLEFRFNEVGEITGIYSPGRFGRFDGEYRQVPWEGYFRDYRAQAGMKVPSYGEVGWYDNGVLQLVWKGNVSDVQYEFEP